MSRHARHARRRLLLDARPCPACGLAHGHTRWAIAQASAARPLQCRQCGAAFHPAGGGRGFLLFFLVPAMIFFAMHWVVGLASLVVTVTALAVLITRHRPLVRAAE